MQYGRRLNLDFQLLLLGMYSYTIGFEDGAKGCVETYLSMGVSVRNCSVNKSYDDINNIAFHSSNEIICSQCCNCDKCDGPKLQNKILVSLGQFLLTRHITQFFAPTFSWTHAP